MDAGWNFDTTYTTLPGPFFRRLDPAPVAEPRLVLLNETLAGRLGLDVDALRSDEGVEVFAGNRVPKGGEPLAMAYAGHQFGGFTMLGDGRAMLLGEHVTRDGERVDVQLKGSGPTPYSRGGDGRAVLGPMLREYVISEAMYALGIPTTRGLAVATTGEPVFREGPLPGAVLTRVAAGHVRVGTFQFAAQWHGPEAVRTLADYTLDRHFPDIVETSSGPGDGTPDGARYLRFLEAVIELQVELIVRWQLVGFIHGVMNTDNMAVAGETIDYGPCAFMDVYDPETVFSSIDRQGRYAYGNQPSIAQWNLARFAETLLPLLDEDEHRAVEKAQEAITAFATSYRRRWLDGMRAKLGLAEAEEADRELVESLLALMERHEADYTNTFRALTVERNAPSLVTNGAAKGKDEADAGTETLFAAPDFSAWRERWLARAQQESDGKAAGRLMVRANPAIIPRNHRVEEALEAAEQGDLSVVKRLMRVLDAPFAYESTPVEFVEIPAPSSPAYVTYCGT